MEIILCGSGGFIAIHILIENTICSPIFWFSYGVNSKSLRNRPVPDPTVPCRPGEEFNTVFWSHRRILGGGGMTWSGLCFKKFSGYYVEMRFSRHQGRKQRDQLGAHHGCPGNRYWKLALGGEGNGEKGLI